MSKFWMTATMAALLLSGSAPAQTGGPAFNPVFESNAALTPQNHIDELVFAHWKQLGIQPARLASDGVFVRRAYLDVIGTLPTADETRDFLKSTSLHKRADLIDSLLEREEFADYWTMRWSDALRIKAEFPINLWPNAAQGYHHWIFESLHDDKPYDQFARELLTSSGSDFRVAPVNFYRAMQNKDPQTIARSVALTFMGTRLEDWPADKQAQMALFFSHVGYKSTMEWKEEIVFFDAAGSAGAVKRSDAQLAAVSLPRTAVLPDGKSVRLDADTDPRQVFAAWLTSPANPYFSKAIVNRIWYWIMGRALTADPDELIGKNPPENPALLNYLAAELVRDHYNLKQIYREILTSETYQLSSLPRGDAAKASAHFAAYNPRRLDAEVLIDALCQITGTSEDYSSAIPEPFTFMPPGQRAISLPDGSISSAFLEQFGKPARDTGLQSERNNSFTDAQRLHLLNSSQVQNKLTKGDAMLQLARNSRSYDDLITSLYVTILSRYPSADERALALKRFQSGGSPRDAAVDLSWALINTTEFLYRH